MKQRPDDFTKRREHLKHLTDEEIKVLFEQLTDQIVDPLLELAYTHTTPAIERSVLMRMGFSSIEAKILTEKMMDYHLLEHGAGHIVYRFSKDEKISIREAGLKLMDTKYLAKIAEVYHEHQ
ncbi:MAG: ornithine aminomutase subunit alpha [Acholeplasmataceae bacterium]|jgi:D-ornithine 4,5-aminomutase subunit alpha|nr:ornithine aminomutase subunit alpha [Acholeplasmataceae bacterium]